MQKTRAGFTLVELLVVVWILAIVLMGMVQLFIYTSVQAEMAGRVTAAVSEAQDKIEEIRIHNYDLIVADYASAGTPGNTFTPSLITGKGRVEIGNSNSEILDIRVVVCWRDKYNRIIGEDTNLNGQLDGGEDQDGDNILDSPIVLMSRITRR